MRYLLVLSGIATSAAGQIMLKRSSSSPAWAATWWILIGLSVILFSASFVFSYYILRSFPISKIYPVMTIGVVFLITIYGLIVREPISTRQSIGLILGAGSIYLILG